MRSHLALGLALLLFQASHAAPSRWSKTPDPFAIEHTLPLAETVADLKQQLEAFQKLDLVSQVADLQRQVQALKGQLDEQGHRLKAQQTMTRAPKPHRALKPRLDVSAVYRDALMQIKAKHYHKAQTALTGLLRHAEARALQPNLYYWLGEIALVEGKLKQAKTHFTTVERQFAQSSKWSDATFKLGIIAEEEGQIKLAKRYYQRVIRRHAGSATARLASQALKHAG